MGKKFKHELNKLMQEIERLYPTEVYKQDVEEEYYLEQLDKFIDTIIWPLLDIGIRALFKDRECTEYQIEDIIGELIYKYEFLCCKARPDKIICEGISKEIKKKYGIKDGHYFPVEREKEIDENMAELEKRFNTTIINKHTETG